MASNALALTLVLPPKPFQRATGTRHSRPAASAAWASARLLFQLETQRSGTAVNASPPEHFEPNSPSLKLLPSSSPGLRVTAWRSRSRSRHQRMRALVIFLPFQGFLPGPIGRHVARHPAQIEIKRGILRRQGAAFLVVADQAQHQPAIEDDGAVAHPEVLFAAIVDRTHAFLHGDILDRSALD